MQMVLQRLQCLSSSAFPSATPTAHSPAPSHAYTLHSALTSSAMHSAPRHAQELSTATSGGRLPSLGPLGVTPAPPALPGAQASSSPQPSTEGSSKGSSLSTGATWSSRSDNGADASPGNAGRRVSAGSGMGASIGSRVQPMGMPRPTCTGADSASGSPAVGSAMPGAMGSPATPTAGLVTPACEQRLRGPGVVNPFGHSVLALASTQQAGMAAPACLVAGVPATPHSHTPVGQVPVPAPAQQPTPGSVDSGSKDVAPKEATAKHASIKKAAADTPKTDQQLPIPQPPAAACISPPALRAVHISTETTPPSASGTAAGSGTPARTAAVHSATPAALRMPAGGVHISFVTPNIPVTSANPARRPLLAAPKSLMHTLSMLRGPMARGAGTHGSLPAGGMECVQAAAPKAAKQLHFTATPAGMLPGSSPRLCTLVGAAGAAAVGGAAEKQDAAALLADAHSPSAHSAADAADTEEVLRMLREALGSITSPADADAGSAWFPHTASEVLITSLHTTLQQVLLAFLAMAELAHRYAAYDDDASVLALRLLYSWRLSCGCGMCGVECIRRRALHAG